MADADQSLYYGLRDYRMNSLKSKDSSSDQQQGISPGTLVQDSDLCETYYKERLKLEEELLKMDLMS